MSIAIISILDSQNFTVSLGNVPLNICNEAVKFIALVRRFNFLKLNLTDTKFKTFV